MTKGPAEKTAEKYIEDIVSATALEVEVAWRMKLKNEVDQWNNSQLYPENQSFYTLRVKRNCMGIILMRSSCIYTIARRSHTWQNQVFS